MSEQSAESLSSEEPAFWTPLKKAREDKGYSLRDVAQELNLPVRYIESVENGQWEQLPSLVFARGYLRSYARLVDLDDASLLDSFDREHSGTLHSRTSIQSVSQVQEQVKLGDPMMRWSLRLFGVVIIAAIIWWWKTQYGLSINEGESSVAVVEEVSEQQPLLSEDGRLVLPQLNDVELELTTSLPEVEVVQEEQEPTYLSSEEVTALAKEMARESEADPVPEAGPDPAPQDPAASELVNVQLEAENLGLSLAFSGESWFSIKDGAGKVLAEGMRKAGDQVALTGVEPLRVIIGNASAVSAFSYQGTSIDLAAYSRGNVAKLSLPVVNQ